jgi:peptidoglycan/LPS O-acetylase OafA/YrhL
MRKAELPGLTGVRFYAALFVYLSHVVETLPGMGPLGGSYLIFNAGVVSVSFFFVLSGFILTYNYADAFCAGVSVSRYKRFVWDRWAKIYPVHLLAIMLVMPAAVFSPHLPLDWRAVPINGLLLQSWWPSSTPAFMNYLNVPSWALSCEWFFYVVTPLAIYLVFKDRYRWIPLSVTLLHLCGLGWLLWDGQPDAVRLHWVSWFAPSRFVEFLAGMYMARLFLASPRGKLAEASTLLQTMGALLILLGAMYRPHAAWPLWGGLLYMPGSLLFIMGLAYGRGVFASHLSHPWLNRLGVASFVFYMIHAPMLRLAKGVFLYMGWEVKSPAMFLAVILVMLIPIQAAAIAICFHYEIPTERWLRGLAGTRLSDPIPMASR